MPALGQRGGGVLDLGARQAIDDAGVAGVALADEGLELGRRVLLVDDFVADVRAVEARDEARRAGKPEPRRRSPCASVSSAVAVSAMRGTSGKRSAMHGQADIFRAEIVPPLRHAMRLVDREQRDLGAAEQRRGSAASAAARARRRAGRDRRRAAAARPRAASSNDSVEFSTAALTPASSRPATWSRISAISGETTMPQPSRNSAGNW